MNRFDKAKTSINLHENLNNKHYFAFTLAEVLITLGVIGIVAAITIPTLITNYKERVTVTRLKKVYSILSQAMTFTIVKYGDYSSLSVVNDDNASIKNFYLTALKPYINVTKECFNTAGCWASGTKLLNGSDPSFMNGNGIGNHIVVFNTIDGYAVNLDVYGALQWGTSQKSPYLVIHVDINGNKKPNILGKDIFVLTFSPERGLIPAGHDLSDNEVNSDCSKTGKGHYCFEKIIRDGWKINNTKL